MLYGFIGRVSPAADLKEALDVGSQRTRLIADRVAKASMTGDGFAASLEEAQGMAPADAEDGVVDIEAEMVALADEQIRYETTATLLQKAYQNIRLSLRGQ